MISRRRFMALGAAVGAGLLIPSDWTTDSVDRVFAQGQIPVNPLKLTKYIDPLPIPGVMPATTPGGTYYEIGAYQLHQRLHSQLPPTTVWGYGASQATAGYPAATLEVKRGVPIQVKWKNELHSVTHPLPVDPSLHWANPLGEPMHMPDTAYPPGFTYTLSTIPIATHVHGGEQEPASDGGPESWFTPGFAIKGPTWQKEVLSYANEQPPTTLWYHDHALGLTRLNVHMGLAGFYIIRDPGNEPAGLPSGQYEIPIVIQDRMFDLNGQFIYPNAGVNPDMHPFWVPEFFGDTILVNGKVWPYLEVERRKYRFRILNGSNARFYRLFVENVSGGTIVPRVTQIGTDGGYLYKPTQVNEIILGPGERADVVVDFSNVAAGTQILLRNLARAPFPAGGGANVRTVGQIMQFRVVPRRSPDVSVIPTTLNPALKKFPSLTAPTVTRTLTLTEVMGMGGPLEVLLNGTNYHAPVTETPTLGTTELWEIINLTADTHPMHWHLVQFQLVNRQRFDVVGYTAAFDTANPVIPIPEGSAHVPVKVDPYLLGWATPPLANEKGWKDTVQMNPGEVTRILMRFAPIGAATVTPYPYDATAEPGYVWHCHIIDHEDNDMMRPLKVRGAGASQAAEVPSAETTPTSGEAAPTFEPSNK